ncbi:MAG TPA: hypothetical protein PKI14_00160 [Fervidobacterium sp.]|nr:hypothetical protein [Fervidobacterium sp.]HPT53324.1 hypothetical protein [Fervidobacterium sp.]HPZ16936.1 hypothetical protein [Fervidobacterium sp.]HQE47751.1 hypothetical protein [Fervidobacterium sp.]HUM41346.1 hypothetical protein [Fervidobacterium sp.]
MISCRKYIDSFFRTSFKTLITTFLALIVLLTTMIYLISTNSVAFAAEITINDTAVPKIPNNLGIGKIEIGKPIKVDGKTFPFTFIDGMLLEDGFRKIDVDGQMYNVTVDTSPLELRLNSSVESYTFVLDSTALFYDPMKRSMKSLSKGTEIKLSEALHLSVLSDEFGNVSDVICVPPLLEKLDILDSYTPINNISGKKFLLSSKSPYRIMGRVLLPTNSALILEEGVTVINALNSDLNVKGLFFSTGSTNFFGPGSITVSENGIAYLEGTALETKINGNGGSLIFLNSASVNSMNISQTNFVVIRNTHAKDVKISFAYAVYIIDSQIESLDIQNCRQVFINNTSSPKFSADIMSKIITYNSEFNSAILSDLSEANFVSSTIDNLNLTRGAVVKVKNTRISSVSVEDYSILYVFKSTIEKLKSINSKYYTLSSQISKIEKQQ